MDEDDTSMWRTTGKQKRGKKKNLKKRSFINFFLSFGNSLSVKRGEDKYITEKNI